MEGINPVSDFGLQIADYSRSQDLLPEGVKAQSGPGKGGEQEKKRIARDFESVLLTKLFDQVRESTSPSSFEEDGEDGASQQVHGLFWLYLAQDVADKGGFGMWQEIYRHFEDIEGTGAAGALDKEL